MLTPNVLCRKRKYACDYFTYFVQHHGQVHTIVPQARTVVPRPDPNLADSGPGRQGTDPLWTDPESQCTIILVT